MFYFLGKIEPWGGNLADLSYDPTPATTLEGDNSIRNDIVYMRRVKGNDVSLVAPNYEWESGQVYTQWDHTLNMIGQRFYVRTDQFHVFKCLDNVQGKASTSKPTKPITNIAAPFKTADGYTWKYMYSIPEFKRNKFLSSAFLPVQRALSDSFYSKGAIEQVVVVEQGAGYTTVGLPTVTVSGGGTPTTPAVIELVVSGGSIVATRIADPGAGYSSNPTLTVTQGIGGLGTGKYTGNTTAILKAFIDDTGKVDNVTIEDPGVNYGGSVPTITVTGDGTGASFAPVVSDGKIVDVIVTNPGQNYTYAILTVVPISGNIPTEVADLQVVLTTSDFQSDQSIVEQSPVVGAIYSVRVSQQGVGYTPTTIMTIEGDGTGAVGVPFVEDGQVKYVTMSSWGSGYTYATITFSDPNRPPPVNPTTDNATAYAVLPPNKGHGVDAVREMYADTMCVYSLIGDDVQLNALNQQYRQLGLIVNPTERLSGKLVTSDRNYITFDIEFNSVGLLAPDTVLINDNKRYRVVLIAGQVVKLIQMNPVYGDPNVGLPFVNEADVNTSYQATRIISSPVVDKYSGYLLCVSNETPFAPAATQSIATRTFIKL